MLTLKQNLYDFFFQKFMSDNNTIILQQYMNFGVFMKLLIYFKINFQNNINNN